MLPHEPDNDDALLDSMSRRAFTGAAAGALGALLIGRELLQPVMRTQQRVNSDRLLRHLRALSRFGETEEGGANRVAFSDADRTGREYVIDLMRNAGLETEIDAAGNLLGRRAGSHDLPPLMFGSHIDSVPDGGNYDGPVGSIGAIEVAQVLAEQGIRTRHPIEVVIFTNEEGGKTGSRAVSGEVDGWELDLGTASGKTIGEGIAFVGGDPARLDSVRRGPGDIAAYLELHVEQGAILEARNVDIGVVEGIVGIKRWNVTVAGRANHAGTTPMDQRQDALLAAAEFISTVHRVVRELPGRHVATVGRIAAEPGAPNVIPGRVTLSLEIRDLSMRRIDLLFAEMREAARRVGADAGTEFTFDQFYLSRAAPTDERIRDRIERVATELGLSALRMPSGAGHDAQSIAQLAPVGMIFVPSVGGISHSPKEFSEPRDVVNGVNVLLHAVLNVDTGTW